MACKRSAVRSRLAPPPPKSRLERWSRALLLAGAGITALGMLLGFGALFLGRGLGAIPFLSLAPIGVVTAFAGLVGVLVASPEPRSPNLQEFTDSDES